MDRLLSQPAKLAKPVGGTSARAVRDLAPPAWARQLVCDDEARFSLVSARVKDVSALSPAEFERRTFEAYVSIARQLLRGGKTCHAVRFWNHVPFITDPADPGRDNYMVFNAGRFRAFTDWFGGPAQFDRDVATGTFAAMHNLRTARHGHVLTPLDDGRVLVAGGATAADRLLDSVEIMDPRRGRWSDGARLRTARAN